MTDEVYEKHLQRSAREAESRDTHSYHCATPDCTGWCTYDDDVNTFFCYVCRRFNCLTCRAIHDGQNCLEYQRELRAKKYKDPAAMLANSTLEVLLTAPVNVALNSGVHESIAINGSLVHVTTVYAHSRVCLCNLTLMCVSV